MSRSLYEQIANKCIHFNGIMNKTCKVGINYDDVKVDRPFRFPCLKQGGQCSHAQFMTDQEIKIEMAEIEELETKILDAMTAIKDHFNETKIRTGKIPCQCGGDLHYSVAELNGHVWAKCNSCGISFNE